MASLCNNCHELAKTCEKANVDLRIILLERDFGSNLVSDAIHRHLSHTFVQAKVLVTAQMLMKSSLEGIDPRFVIHFKYDEMLENPRKSAKFLAQSLRVPLKSTILDHFIQVFELNRQSHYHGTDLNGTRWRNEVNKKFLKYYLNDMEVLFNAV